MAKQAITVVNPSVEPPRSLVVDALELLLDIQAEERITMPREVRSRLIGVLSAAKQANLLLNLGYIND